LKGKIMNKKIIFSLVALFVVLIALASVFVPKILEKKNVEALEKTKATNEAFTNKILEQFSLNPNIKASTASQNVCDELNERTQNPYDKNKPACTFERECKACMSVEFDDNLSMVIVTTYDPKGELAARTVIKPPSFVTYNKADDNKKETETND